MWLLEGLRDDANKGCLDRRHRKQNHNHEGALAWIQDISAKCLNIGRRGDIIYNLLSCVPLVASEQSLLSLAQRKKQRNIHSQHPAPSCLRGVPTPHQTSPHMVRDLKNFSQKPPKNFRFWYRGTRDGFLSLPREMEEG